MCYEEVLVIYAAVLVLYADVISLSVGGDSLRDCSACYAAAVYSDCCVSIGCQHIERDIYIVVSQYNIARLIG